MEYVRICEIQLEKCANNLLSSGCGVSFDKFLLVTHFTGGEVMLSLYYYLQLDKYLYQFLALSF